MTSAPVTAHVSFTSRVYYPHPPQVVTLSTNDNENPNFGDNIPYASQSMWYNDTFLQRPEFSKYNGNPLEYRTFMNNFKRHNVHKVRDPKMLLCYLLQHCEATVKDKIQHC